MPPTQQPKPVQFGLRETASEVRELRGNPRETIGRIRAKYDLPTSMSDFEIFRRCLVAYNGVVVAEKTAAFHYQRYGQFIASGMPESYELPLAVARAIDRDVAYKNLCA